MILDPQIQIPEIIKNRPNQKLVEKGVDYNKMMRKHLYGKDLDINIKQVDGYEGKSMHELRKKYSKSNKDLFSRLGRPIDKVFSAKGGKVYYSLPEAQEKKAMLLAADVHNGSSVREWVKNYWKPHMLDDPFGIVFMEIMPKQQVALAKQQGKSFVYPTYKPITKIYDYLPAGNQLEYVVFEVSNDEKMRYGLEVKDQIFRVVDDAFDYIVRRDGDNVTVVNSLTLLNYFRKVPAMINSDIINPDDDHCFLSFYDDAVELAEQFWLKGSIKVTHDFLHGFPKYSEFADDCDKCNGSGYFEAEQCPACKGTKKKLMFKVSDAKALNWPTKDEQVILPTQVAGYISPDKTYYEIATSDLQMLEDAMTVTLWGVQSKLKASGPVVAASGAGDAKTATEVMDETKPIADRLHEISAMAERRHKFILDAVVMIQVSNNYTGSSVNYGRRYLLESPDAIWKKYSDARTKGAPQNILDELLNEYNESMYQSDPIGREIANKMMYVEPFVHLRVSELKALSPAPIDYTAKLYFSEWLATLTESAVLVQSVDELKSSLYEFASEKQALIPEPQKEPIPV